MRPRSLSGSGGPRPGSDPPGGGAWRPLDPLPPPVAPRARTRGEVWSIVVMGTVFLVCAAAFWGDDGPVATQPSALTPLTLGQLHPSIEAVVEKSSSDGALELTLLQASPMYPASVVSDFSRDALAVCRQLRKFFPAIDNPTLRFVVKAPARPGLGSAAEAVPLLSLDFKRTELMTQVGAADFTAQELLNRAVTIRFLNPTGRRYVASFCADPVADSAREFCRRQAR